MNRQRMQHMHVGVVVSLLVSHMLLHFFSPSYQQHERRFLAAFAPSWAGGGGGGAAPRRVPATGVYASTLLLQAVQQHMHTLDGEGRHTTGGAPLVAYTSGAALLEGQGWPAYMLFLQWLAAPRFVLSWGHGRMQYERSLFNLAAHDMPAVGLLERSEDPSAGYRMACHSPPLQLGRGPQPVAHCTVFARRRRRPRHQQPASEDVRRQRLQGLWAGVAVLTGGSSGSGSSSGGGAPSPGKVLAEWTILPDETRAGVEALLRQPGAPQQGPYLGGWAPSPPNALTDVLDEALMYPRATLLQLVPSLTRWQQLVLGGAACVLTYLDLLWLTRGVTVLTTRFDASMSPLLEGSSFWRMLMVGCGATTQLGAMLLLRTVTAALICAALSAPPLLAAAAFATSPAAALLRRLLARPAAAVVAAATRGWAASRLAAAAGPLLRVCGSAVSAAQGGQQALLVAWCALRVWALHARAARRAWAALARAGADAAVLLECATATLPLLVDGAGWRITWRQFAQRAGQRLRAAQRQRDHARAAAAAGVQAQVVIHAQGQGHVDVGHTADALRALADELDALDGAGDRGLLVAPGGHVVVGPPPPRRLRLGEHWPAPLQLDFDADDVREELGLEVPSGMLCPLTMEVMRQPALLLSSNVPVPSSYEREAIERWLAQRRQDPKSRRPLAADAQLVPNFDLYRAIDDFGGLVRSLRAQRRALDLREAAAAAQAGAGGGDAAAAAADAGGQQQHGGAAAAAGGAGAPQGSGSGATISSVLAAVVRGTAAAAAAAVRGARGGGDAQQRRSLRLPQGRRQRRGSGSDSDPDDHLLSGEEDDDDGGLSSDDSDGGEDTLSQGQDEKEEDDEVRSPANGVRRRGAAAARAAAAAAGAGAGARAGPSPGPQQQQRQPSGGRYNLRQRSPAC